MKIPDYKLTWLDYAIYVCMYVMGWFCGLIYARLTEWD